MFVKKRLKRILIKKPLERFLYFTDDLFNSAASRAFLRAAVFFLITPRFAALSIALYAAESCFICSSRGAPVALRVNAVTSCNFLLFRKLKTCFRTETRAAFFADFVIAMSPEL